MDTLLLEKSVTSVNPEHVTTARQDPETFLRWCKKEFRQRFHKNVFFIVQNDERDARNMAEFLDSYMTNELRAAYGANSLFFQELKTIIRNKSRRRELVDARHMIMRLLHDTNITLVQIGIIMGGRDHTTVIHGLKQHENLYDTNTAYRKQYEHLKYLCISEGYIFTADSIKDYAESTVCIAEL
jgi:hypothetical protein